MSSSSSSSKHLRLRPVTPPIGALLANRYRVEDTLGKGGMGVVLAVREEASGEPLAIKLLGDAAELGDGAPESTEDTHDRATRLKREAQASMRIASEHVVRVRDVSAGGTDVGPYIVMERLEGTDLADAWPLGTKMPVKQVVDVALQVCEALSHAHLAGIIHRDIKPSNLFAARKAKTGGGDDDGDDNEVVIKVLDFGISKVTTRAEWERTEGTLTVGDAVLGSPQFVSPEQLRDSRTVDARADIWSLGVVMYRLATGAYPFSGETIGQLFTRILERDPKVLSSHGVKSSELQAVIDRCLKRDRDARYASVAELAKDLAPMASDRWTSLAGAIASRLARQTRARSSPPPSGSSSASFGSSSRRGIVLFGVAVVVGIGVLVWNGRSPTTTPSTNASASIATASAPSLSPSSSSPSSAGIEVTVTVSADHPIEKVHAPGLRRALLEDGRATLILAEWTGELEVEAELAGGSQARAAITMAGPRDVRLMTIAPPLARPPSSSASTTTIARSVPHGPTNTAGAAPTPPTSAAPAPAPSTSSSSGDSELHANPYAPR